MNAELVNPVGFIWQLWRVDVGIPERPKTCHRYTASAASGFSIKSLRIERTLRITLISGLIDIVALTSWRAALLRLSRFSPWFVDCLRNFLHLGLLFDRLDFFFLNDLLFFNFLFFHDN